MEFMIQKALRELKPEDELLLPHGNIYTANR